MPSPAHDLEGVRSRIPLLKSKIPLNNCSQTPQSEVTRGAAEAYLTSWNEAGMDWDVWIEEVERARRAFARLIGAEPADVAVATSVSQATASVASGLDYSGRRHRVVASGAEFPTVGQVWLAQERFGAEVDWVPVRDGLVKVEDYADVIDEQTLVVSACHGYYQTGFRQDVSAIAEIAHQRGALLYVDAYQTLGTAPFHAPGSGADFVASGCLKYLMGVPGLAFLWVRPGLANGLEPAITGWFGRADPFAFDARRLDWGEGARRLDTGTPPVFEAYVCRAAMEWLEEIGLEAIGAWNAALARHLTEGGRERGLKLLAPIEPERRTPVAAFTCADSHAVEVSLRQKGIIASARGPALRLAPHFYNTLDDIDQALDALAPMVKGTS